MTGFRQEVETTKSSLRGATQNHMDGAIDGGINVVKALTIGSGSRSCGNGNESNG
jgi:hypothetical protein